MNILNIELTRIEGTKLGFKVDDKELLDYLVSTWKCRDLVNHSVQMHEIEIKGKIWYNYYLLNRNKKAPLNSASFLPAELIKKVEFCVQWFVE